MALQRMFAGCLAGCLALALAGCGGPVPVEGKVTMNGKSEVRSVKIDQAVVDPADVEVLEDLVLAACNDAKQKVTAHAETEMQKLTGGLGLPGGFKLPF